MSKMKVVCPNCRRLLTLDEVPGIGDKMLSCPICSFRAKVSVYQQQSIGGGKQPVSDEYECTQVSFGMMDRTIGSLFHGTEEYSLHKGSNSIGRRAKTGHAEVQISDDKYMSRQHASIEIREGHSGLEHHLLPTNPKNPIKVNGVLLENTDDVVLQWGDKLTFGRTELLFERPHFNEDQTLVES